MAALLVALAVMAVLMSVALPVWRHEAQREKEAELVFRGQQYVRAIRLFQAEDPRRCRPASTCWCRATTSARSTRTRSPTTTSNSSAPAACRDSRTARSRPGSRQAAGTDRRAGDPRLGSTAGQRAVRQPQQIGSAFGGGTVPGGMMGVRSKSKDESIRLYLGRNHYNEWTFIYVVSQQPGGPGRPRAAGRAAAGRGSRGRTRAARADSLRRTRGGRRRTGPRRPAGPGRPVSEAHRPSSPARPSLAVAASAV